LSRRLGSVPRGRFAAHRGTRPLLPREALAFRCGARQAMTRREAQAYPDLWERPRAAMGRKAAPRSKARPPSPRLLPRRAPSTPAFSTTSHTLTPKRLPRPSCQTQAPSTSAPFPIYHLSPNKPCYTSPTQPIPPLQPPPTLSPPPTNPVTITPPPTLSHPPPPALGLTPQPKEQAARNDQP